MPVAKMILKHIVLFNNKEELKENLKEYTKELIDKIDDMHIGNVHIITEIREASNKEVHVKTTIK